MKIQRQYAIVFWKIITETGTWPAYIVFLLIHKALHLNWFEPATMAPAGIAWGSSTIIKKMIHRPRPFEVRQEKPLTRGKRGESFPSSHSAASFAWAFNLYWLSVSGWPWVLLWSVLVMTSRWRLRVHYISDLMGGMAVSVLTVLVWNAF